MGYGFKHGGGGATGKPLGTLAVTAPIGAIATISKDGKTYSKVVDAYGVAIFKGLTTGEWAVTIDNGSQTSTQYVMVTLDYAITMAFFTATISVTYPIGSTCTCSDGITTFTAADMSGNCVFTVPNAGTWTVEITDGVSTVNSVVNITSDGQSESVRLAFFSATISVTYPAGSTCTCSDGSTTLTAPDTSGSYVFIVRNTGSWTVTATDGEDTTSDIVMIGSDGQSVNITLDYDTLLFNNGVDKTELTGGWTGYGYVVDSGYSGVSSTVTIEDDHLVMKMSSSKTFASSFASTVNTVDLTEYGNLHFDFLDASGPGWAVVRIFNASGTPVASGPYVWKTGEGFTNSVDMDISEISGACRVGVMMWTNTANGVITVKVSQVKLSYDVQ